MSAAPMGLECCTIAHVDGNDTGNSKSYQCRDAIKRNQENTMRGNTRHGKIFHHQSTPTLLTISVTLSFYLLGQLF